MPRNKLSKTLTIEREKKVWHMRMRGATYERIAQEIGITFGGVSKILNRLHNRYREKNMDSIEKHKLEQIGELSNIADEAYQAWERSKESAITKRKKALGTASGGVTGKVEQYHEEKDQDGDPRYLQVYMKAKEDVRKIVGADAPIKSENKSELQIDANQKNASDELEKIYSKIIKDDNHGGCIK